MLQMSRPAGTILIALLLAVALWPGNAALFSQNVAGQALPSVHAQPWTQGAQAEEAWFLQRLDAPIDHWGLFSPGEALKAGSPVPHLRAPRRFSMNQRLAGLESDIPLRIGFVEENLLRVLLVSRRQRSQWMLGASRLFLPEIEEALEAQGLPGELKYLPLAASAWNPAFESRGRAGLWGFDATTARLYGLRVTSQVDERQHPRLSSQAAARRLKDLHDAFADWRLTLAAHGAGPAAVRQAMSKAGPQAGYEQVQAYLPVQARGLVSAFVAGVYVASFHEEEELIPAAVQRPDSMVWGDLDGSEEEQPAATATVSQALAYDDLETTSLYVVRRGDSLGRIASRYEVTVGQLRAWNGLRGDLIHPGQELVLHAPPPSSRSSRNYGSGDYYTVRSGDTLWAISRRTGVSVGRLERLNPEIHPRSLRPGMRLRLQ